MAALTCSASLAVTASRPGVGVRTHNADTALSVAALEPSAGGQGQPVAGALAATATPTGFMSDVVGGAVLAASAGVSAGMSQTFPAAAPLSVTALPYSGDVDNNTSLERQCDQIWFNTQMHRQGDDNERRTQPLVRVWDGEWNLQHILSVDYSSTFSWVSNDSGPGRSEIPFDSPVAQWIHDMQGRIDRGEKRNVHVTVDYCGARWGGRLDKTSVEQRDDGDLVMVVDWLHDYENLKWYQCWSNPFLPAFVQFPRVWLLPGPVTWILKLTLFLQLFREHNPLVTLPDDPLDFTSWFTNLNQSTWQVVVKPQSFVDAMASGVVWGLVSSRFKTWHDMAHVMLEDAELTVECRRYLPGDDPPWPGAVLRYGTLVVDIIDKSGVHVGTSNGGTIFDGLFRTVAEFADDFIDSTDELVFDADTPTDYFLPGWKYTDKEKPYVVFREGESSPIQTSAYINSPAKGVQVNVGGKSMPGINEGISASIQAAGDIIGNLVQIGSLGGTIDTIVKPFYEDTILAWWSMKSPLRAQHSGWSRYFEYFQDPSGKAYTIASLMVLRAGFWATKTTTSWKVAVADGMPFMIGDKGHGHFFLDDRIGLVIKGDTIIRMDRCRKLELTWDPDNPPEWQITIGDERVLQDPAQRAFAKIEAIVSALQELGAY